MGFSGILQILWNTYICGFLRHIIKTRNICASEMLSWTLLTCAVDWFYIYIKKEELFAGALKSIFVERVISIQIANYFCESVLRVFRPHARGIQKQSNFNWSGLKVDWIALNSITWTMAPQTGAGCSFRADEQKKGTSTKAGDTIRRIRIQCTTQTKDTPCMLS